MKTKSSSMAVMSPPRFAGERKPSTAKESVMHDIVTLQREFLKDQQPGIAG